jgi:DNA-binding CsgD family transcriptional regulator
MPALYRLFSAALSLLLLWGCHPATPEEKKDGRDLLEESRLYIGEQDYDDAMDLAIKALEAAEEEQDQPLKADALCTVSFIDLMANRDSQSWQRACEAEEVARANKLFRPLCEALVLKGRVCSYAGISKESNRDDEALVYLQEAYNLSQEHNLSPEHVQACYYISEIYVNKNRWNDKLVDEWYSLAGRYLEEGEALAAADSLEELSRRSVIFRFRYLRQGGRLQEAADYCENIIRNSAPQDWLTRQQIYDHLTVIYSAMGNTQAATENHQNYVYAMQQYMRQRSDGRLQALEDQYAYLLKQREIDRKQRLVVILIVVLAFLILLLLESYIYNNKIKLQNKKLEEADTSKKNLLEAISSDLVEVSSIGSVSEIMQLARKSNSMKDEEIHDAVKEVIGKGTSLSEDVSEYFYRLILHRKKNVDSSGLSERELEILRLCGQGLSTAKIAEILYISPRTVSNHKQNIYSKMGVKSMPEMIFKAKEAGLL